MVEIKTLEDINRLALMGNPDALDKVSKYAFGGNIRAKEVIREIEDNKIVFKEVVESPKISKRSNLGQIIFHPVESLRTKARQIMVSFDRDEAPTGSNQEDFPNLGIAEAAALLRKNKATSGVPFEAWTKRDQKRMEAGLKPKGHPEHPNV